MMSSYSADMSFVLSQDMADDDQQHLIVDDLSETRIVAATQLTCLTVK